jgi:protocatechuate 3,4-dioxygenase beta subunit
LIIFLAMYHRRIATMTRPLHTTRRRAITLIAKVAALLPFAASAGEGLKPTPEVTVGPFYPPDPTGLPFFGARALSPLPLGNDLTTGPNGRRAEGITINLGGRVFDRSGVPIAGAKVEIWQVDARGHYAVETGADHDPGFAGYGTHVTDAEGAYAFTTIRPKAYGRYGGLIQRTAHIHMRVWPPRRKPLTTEVWFAGEPGNEGDSFVSRIRDLQLRRRMLVRLEPDSEGRRAGVFDVVIPSA